MRSSSARRRPSNFRSSESSLGRKHRPDYWLLALSIILLAVGLVVVYSITPALSAAAHVSSSHYIVKQLLAVGLSLVAFIFTAKVPLSAWRKAYKPLLLVAATATFIALILPVNADYPAHRWMRLGGLSFQTVELLKFAILIWLAAMLSRKIYGGPTEEKNRAMKPLMIALGVIGLVVAGLQSDLGSAGVIVVMMGAMMFVAGLPIKRVLATGLAIALIVLLFIAISPYRRERLNTYLHPESSCQTDSGYQACQALISVGSGGMFGLGLGRSVQAYGYLPQAANDSIFAIYAEKFGFIGSVILLGLFTALFARLKSIAERAPDNFSRLLVVGVLTWLGVQSLVNIGAMIGLLPLKGITLPFISYGGTSVIFVAAAMGLAFQVSRYTSYTIPFENRESKRSAYDNRLDRRRVRGAYHPTFGSRG